MSDARIAAALRKAGGDVHAAAKDVLSTLDTDDLLMPPPAT